MGLSTWWIAVVFLISGLTAPAPAQQTWYPQGTVYMRSGWVEPTVRDAELKPLWVDSVGAHERAGCVTKWGTYKNPIKRTFEFAPGLTVVDSQYMVLGIKMTKDSAATGITVHTSCAKGQPPYHTHQVQPTPVDSYQCQPSADDYLNLLSLEAPFGLIQCSAQVVVFFWPQDFKPEKPSGNN